MVILEADEHDWLFSLAEEYFGSSVITQQTGGNKNPQAPKCGRGYDEPLITGSVKAGVISGHLARVCY